MGDRITLFLSPPPRARHCPSSLSLGGIPARHDSPDNGASNVWGCMRNFCKIIDGIDVIPLLNALVVNPDLWNENKLRTTHPLSPHKETDDIWCMFNRVSDDPEEVIDDLEVVPYRAWHTLPHLHDTVLNLMRRVDGTRLGRVLITRLKPGASIPAHVDEGAPATYYSRYQLVLQSLPGALFTIGEEVINFRTGDFWWINNRDTHSVTNNSADDRIVLIMDVRGPLC